MPSKIRYILFTPEQNFRGSQVVAMLCKLARNNLFNLQLPKDWASYSTQSKLEFLAQFLPEEYKLVIFREPKWTRKKRSRYALELSKGSIFKKKLTFKQQMAEVLQVQAQGQVGLAPNIQFVNGNGIAVPQPNPNGVVYVDDVEFQQGGIPDGY
jgi:hypothetical protein